MSEAAKWTVIGVVVAVVLAGAAVAAVETLPGKKRPDRPAGPSVSMVRLGPDGTPKTTFDENLKNASVPASEGYDLCLGDLHVQRPSMITTDMPDSYCTVTRAKSGGWRVSTGGWQRCQVLCFKLAGKG